MKRIATALLVLAAAVFAGDCMSGSSCVNACPLAQQANGRMSTGREAVRTSEIVRSDFVDAVLANLRKI